MLDLTGATAATPATPPGVVFCPWNPDESYTRDALIRVQARLGTPEPACVIYDHLDLLIHPLGVHLTERVASQFWVRLCGGKCSGLLAQSHLMLPAEKLPRCLCCWKLCACTVLIHILHWVQDYFFPKDKDKDKEGDAAKRAEAKSRAGSRRSSMVPSASWDLDGSTSTPPSPSETSSPKDSRDLARAGAHSLSTILRCTLCAVNWASPASQSMGLAPHPRPS